MSAFLSCSSRAVIWLVRGNDKKVRVRYRPNRNKTSRSLGASGLLKIVIRLSSTLLVSGNSHYEISIGTGFPQNSSNSTNVRLHFLLSRTRAVENSIFSSGYN